MSIEAIAAAGAGMPPAMQMPSVQAGPSAAIGDITSFEGSLSAAGPAAAGGVGGPDSLGPAMKVMFSQLEKVNGEAKSVAQYASSATASGSEMSPGEVVQLTMRCHEFMFHCQLTSNIANRTSDGIQQLFRQQS
jgi:hypothetical protein